VYGTQTSPSIEEMCDGAISPLLVPMNKGFQIHSAKHPSVLYSLDQSYDDWVARGIDMVDMGSEASRFVEQRVREWQEQQDIHWFN
jgi:hypothetical protein